MNEAQRLALAAHDQALAEATVREAIRVLTPIIARQYAQAGFEAARNFYAASGALSLVPTQTSVRADDNGTVTIQVVRVDNAPGEAAQ